MPKRSETHSQTLLDTGICRGIVTSNVAKRCGGPPEPLKRARGSPAFHNDELNSSALGNFDSVGCF